MANDLADLLQCHGCGRWFISVVGFARVPRPFICAACRREEEEEAPLQLRLPLELCA